MRPERKKEEKIDVPVLFGENGEIDKSFYADGEIVEDECVDWGYETDDDGNVLHEHGGFKDYLEFADDLDIYGQTKKGRVT